MSYFYRPPTPLLTLFTSVALLLTSSCTETALVPTNTEVSPTVSPTPANSSISLTTRNPFTLPTNIENSPILRLETGMHTAIISRLDIDASQRYLVTGSHDKTVRVWSLPEGQLLKVLRPPIGAGDEGKIYAVAISPDGQTVAMGGWTKEDAIYLFNRATGELRTRITGLPNVVNHLAYSHNGDYLVASLGGANGIRIYRTANVSLVSEDSDYEESSYWAEFDSKGRLVTSSRDGYVRLYDSHFKLLSQEQPGGGEAPFAVRFSPKGDQIAVGFSDSTHIDVLSGENLTLLYRPNTQTVNNGDLSTPAWSSDGRWLYAGGRYHDGTTCPILRWAEAGQGRLQQWSAASNVIMDLRTLREGQVVFVTAEPSGGMFNADGKPVLLRETEIADFRSGKNASLLVSHAGDVVQFNYALDGKRWGRFVLQERLLTLNPPPSSSPTKLAAPRLQSPELQVTDWLNSTEPQLNETPVSLAENEISRSVAISPDGTQFLLGTDWALRLFDKQGNPLWEVATPEAVWSVNIAGNGKVAIAALGDGTLRWYRLQDGEELLALFPHKDGKRWVLWTPQGYYDASAGANDLIGWHLNRGPNQAADFFPVSQFRERFYRPEVLAKLLKTFDLTKAIQEAQVETGQPELQSQQTIQEVLPPVVTLLSPQDGTTFSDDQVELRYQVKLFTKAPLTGVKILIDGRPLETARGLSRVQSQQNTEQTLQITVPKRDVKLSVIAENRDGASTPATIQLRWQGPPPTQAAVVKPVLYILAVGVSEYDDPKIRLKYAAKDAQDFVKVLKQAQNQSLYRDFQDKLLVDATKQEVLDGLQWIEQQTTPQDVAMVFFAGHGVNENNRDYYFLPRDGRPDQISQTSVAYDKIQHAVSTIAGKALFFIDTCHSGSLLESRRQVADIDQVANDLASAENGVVVFASSTGSQFSLEEDEWQNGAFTEALVEGLSGKADYTRNNGVSVNELDLYLSERVKELTQGSQTPTTAKPSTIQDFAVVLGH